MNHLELQQIQRDLLDTEDKLAVSHSRFDSRGSSQPRLFSRFVEHVCSFSDAFELLLPLQV